MPPGPMAASLVGHATDVAIVPPLRMLNDCNKNHQFSVELKLNKFIVDDPHYLRSCSTVRARRVIYWLGRVCVCVYVWTHL